MTENETLDAQVLALDRKRDPKQRLVPVEWSKISALPKRTGLIGGLLDVGGMSVVFGGSGCGKTFFALDLAAHVANGWAWRGRKLQQGSVLYIAAEGGLGIEERLTAFRLHHRLDVADVPLHVIAEPIDLCRSEADCALLIQRCAALHSLKLIVIDTLSRALGGGNENGPEDMGRFIAHVDRLRFATGAHVLVIHHSGKDEGRGARGHNSLRAAADTEIMVANNAGIVTATVAKQRDHAVGEVFTFKLLPVDLGRLDADGKPLTSCVVEPVEGEHLKKPAKAVDKLNGAERVALRALENAIIERGKPHGSKLAPDKTNCVPIEAWREYSYRFGISPGGEPEARKKAFQRTSKHLIAIGRVGVDDDDGIVWLP